jgi:hypothetical protein
MSLRPLHRSLKIPKGYATPEKYNSYGAETRHTVKAPAISWVEREVALNVLEAKGIIKGRTADDIIEAMCKALARLPGPRPRSRERVSKFTIARQVILENEDLSVPELAKLAECGCRTIEIEMNRLLEEGKWG